MAHFGRDFLRFFASSHASLLRSIPPKFPEHRSHITERILLSEDRSSPRPQFRLFPVELLVEHLFGTTVASLWDMAYATYKSVAITPTQSSLTPCIFDDDPSERDSLAHLITDMGDEPVSTQDAEEALRLIRMGRCPGVFAGIHLENPDPFDFLHRALRCDPGVHVMIMTAQYTLEGALEAIRRGAADFLPKPLDHVRPKRTLDDLAALYDQRRRVRSLEEQLLKDLEFHGIVGKSPAMLEVFDFTRKVARHYTNVLLVGQT